MRFSRYHPVGWLTRGNCSRVRGMTLIEVLVAVVILAIGLIGTSSMMTYAVISHDSAAAYTVAAERATQEIERIRDSGYHGATVGTNLFPTSNYNLLSTTQVEFTCFELKDGHGVITLDIDSEANQTDPGTGEPYSNLKRIDVQIWWNGKSGSTLSYNASTLVANRPT